MATPAQRAKAIIDALHDGDTDNDRVMRILNAFAFTNRRGETLTTPEKARTFIVAIRRMVRQVTLDADRSQAAATAAAAIAGIALGTDGEEQPTP
jgi:hypothetical protein